MSHILSLYFVRCLPAQMKYEVTRYKNIEIPEEIKHLEYCGFRFDVPENGAITFKIWFNEGILPEVWPAERVKLRRSKNDGGKAQKEKQVIASKARKLSFFIERSPER